MSIKSQFVEKFVKTFLITFGIATAAMPVLAVLQVIAGNYGLALELAAVGLAGAVLIGVVIGLTKPREEAPRAGVR